MSVDPPLLILQNTDTLLPFDHSIILRCSYRHSRTTQLFSVLSDIGIERLNIHHINGFEALVVRGWERRRHRIILVQVVVLHVQGIALMIVCLPIE